MLRKPEAWLPMVIAVGSLALLLAVVALHGVEHHADEGTPARVFQLLLAMQAVLIGLFGLRWVPRVPRAGIVVVALQIALAAIPVSLVILLEMQ